jgi:hypothetical protein
MPYPPVTLSRAMVTVHGTADFPHINTNPQNMFMRRVKNQPQHPLYANRQFIMTKNLYDFGPLLIGKNPETRTLYDEKLLSLNRRQQTFLDKQIQEREQSGFAVLPEAAKEEEVSHYFL